MPVVTVESLRVYIHVIAHILVKSANAICAVKLDLIRIETRSFCEMA